MTLCDFMKSYLSLVHLEMVMTLHNDHITSDEVLFHTFFFDALTDQIKTSGIDLKSFDTLAFHDF